MAPGGESPPAYPPKLRWLRLELIAIEALVHHRCGLACFENLLQPDLLSLVHWFRPPVGFLSLSGWSCQGGIRYGNPWESIGIRVPTLGWGYPPVGLVLYFYHALLNSTAGPHWPKYYYNLVVGWMCSTYINVCIKKNKHNIIWYIYYNIE